MIARPSPSLSLDRDPESPQPSGVGISAASRLQPYIGKLEAEGVIQRPGGGFLLDQNRVAYLRYLRRESRQSLQSAAASEFAAAKAELIRIRNAEKKARLEMPVEISEACTKLADQRGEPEA